VFKVVSFQVQRLEAFKINDSWFPHQVVQLHSMKLHSRLQTDHVI